MMIAEPNATLYVKNIDWKIKKPLLRRALYSLFTRHGKVLEIISRRKDGLRGQAWVIFDSVSAATAALQAEQGFTFFEKDLVLEYAKEKSDRVAKEDGTFVPKAKRRKIETKEEEKPSGEADGEGEEQTEEEGKDAEAAEAQVHDPAAALSGDQPPSKYLLADNLPSECNEMMLGMLFRQYAGFVEVRMMPNRNGLAIVEFASEPHATLARTGLHGFQLTSNDKLTLHYGKA